MWAQKIEIGAAALGVIQFQSSTHQSSRQMAYNSSRYMTVEESSRQQFSRFVNSLMLINVNELVNAELYNRVSLITSYTIKHLKQNYTPQDMRAVLLKTDPNKYINGNAIKGSCTAPRKKNRGISHVIGNKYFVGSVPHFQCWFKN